MNQYMVSFPEAIKRAFTNYCCFTGRASRSEYWWFALFNIIVTGAIYLLLGYGSKASTIVIGLYGLATMLPGLGLAFRRMHDIGISGWWIIVLLAAIYILLVIGVFSLLLHEGSSAIGGICFLGGLACYAAMIIMTVLPSQPRPNKYGPVPNVDVKG